VIGDSYSPSGEASGGGRDILNAGFRGDVLVGDSYTNTGYATGSGHDKLHGLTGDDFMYGDNFAANGARGRVASGGGNDALAGAAGDDYLFGGPGEHDICAGGSGRDSAQSSCEFKFQIP
jgi:Ca2+-binding RTX toxin-like protein